MLKLITGYWIATHLVEIYWNLGNPAFSPCVLGCCFFAMLQSSALLNTLNAFN